MREENITTIKKRTEMIQKVLKIVFCIGVIALLVGLIVSVYLLFTSPEKFTAVKGNLNWNLSYHLANSSSFFISIPYKIMQPLDNNLFRAKDAFIASLISVIITILFVLYGIKQILDILNFTSKEFTPFILENVKCLRKLAYSIIMYSAVAGLLTNILFSVFVTKIFSLDLSNIHVTGLLIGGLIFIIADIFKYGVYLQNEFDTTL